MLLRVGVLQGATVVEERLLRAQGAHTFAGVKVFEVRGERVFLVAENRALDVHERGRLRVGDDVTLLFHFVPAPPPEKRPTLPERMRGGLVGEFEPIFSAVVIASFALHAAIGVVVQVSEPPRAPDVEELRRIVENIAPPRIDVPRVTAPRGVAPSSSSASSSESSSSTVANDGGPSRTSTSRGPVDRAAVRDAIRGRGLLAPITGNENGGAPTGTTSVFGRRSVISDDVTGALDGTFGVAVADRDRVARRSDGGEGEGEGTNGVPAVVDVGILGPTRPHAPIDTGAKVAVQVVKRVDVAVDELAPVGGDGASIDARAVRDTLRRRSESFQDCYEGAMKGAAKPKSGKLLMEFTIDETGKVTSSTVLRDGVGSAELGSCVKQTLKRIRFEAPKDGEVTIENSFVFQLG